MKVGDIIAMKAARISDYMGKSLNSGFCTNIIVNPKHKRSEQLKEWVDVKGEISYQRCLTKTKDEETGVKKVDNFKVSQDFLISRPSNKSKMS
jgi:hypothetical protein